MLPLAIVALTLIEPSAPVAQLVGSLEVTVPITGLLGATTATGLPVYSTTQSLPTLRTKRL